jgi:hypothetical protein
VEAEVVVIEQDKLQLQWEMQEDQEEVEQELVVQDHNQKQVDQEILRQ